MITPDIIIIDDATPLSPLFSEVYQFWLEKRKGGNQVSVFDFKLDDLPIKLLSWSIVADVTNEGGKTDYKFRFWGTQRASLIGYDMTGKFLSEIESAGMREGNLREYECVREHNKPILCPTPIVTSTGRSIAMNSIRLPLCTDEDRVTRICSALDPDSVTSEHYTHFGTHPSHM